jgi:hypothetical protein
MQISWEDDDSQMRIIVKTHIPRYVIIERYFNCIFLTLNITLNQKNTADEENFSIGIRFGDDVDGLLYQRLPYLHGKASF